MAKDEIDGKASSATLAGFWWDYKVQEAGTMNVAEYPLSADGETKMDEAPSGARFFRLKAVPAPEGL